MALTDIYFHLVINLPDVQAGKVVCTIPLSSSYPVFLWTYTEYHVWNEPLLYHHAKAISYSQTIHKHSHNMTYTIFLAQAEWHSWIVQQPNWKMQSSVHSSGCVSIVHPQGRSVDASRADGPAVCGYQQYTEGWGERSSWTKWGTRGQEAKLSGAQGWMVSWANHSFFLLRHMVLVECPLRKWSQTRPLTVVMTLYLISSEVVKPHNTDPGKNLLGIG